MEKTTQAKRRYITGSVVSDRMDKTVVVKVERIFKHKTLGKIIRRAKKYKVHDEQGLARVGDTVEFYEGRPQSKTKFMYLSRVLGSSAS